MGSSSLDRRNTTSKGREGAKSVPNRLKFSFPAHSAWGPKSSLPSRAHQEAGFRECFPVHPTLSRAVLFQQTSADPQHPPAAGGCCHCLPAVLLDVFRKVAPDHLTGAHPLQQLLRLLQAAAGPPGTGQGLLVLGQPPEGPGPPVLLSPGQAQGRHPGFSLGIPGKGLLGRGEEGKIPKTDKKKKPPELCIFVTYCFFL